MPRLGILILLVLMANIGLTTAWPDEGTVSPEPLGDSTGSLSIDETMEMPPSVRFADSPPLVVKGRWDFSPPEQIITGRSLREFRKEGTLLSRCVGEPPRIDSNQLQTRWEALAQGERFTDSFQYVGRPTPAAVFPANPSALIRKPEWLGNGGIIFISFMGIGLAGLYVAIRKGLLDRKPLLHQACVESTSDRPKMSVAPSRRQFLP